jgi:HSP20 family protein
MAIERWRPFESMDRWDLFRNIGNIQGEVNRLVEAFSGRTMPATGSQGRPWMPPVDMHETSDALVLRLELPGMNEKDVAVSMTGDFLTIKGERRWDADPENKDQRFLHVERAYGPFERLIQLPMAVQSDKVKAAYRDGVLEITLPKAEELRPREIKIDVL